MKAKTYLGALIWVLGVIMASIGIFPMFGDDPSRIPFLLGSLAQMLGILAIVDQPRI